MMILIYTLTPLVGILSGLFRKYSKACKFWAMQIDENLGNQSNDGMPDIGSILSRSSNSDLAEIENKMTQSDWGLILLKETNAARTSNLVDGIGYVSLGIIGSRTDLETLQNLMVVGTAIAISFIVEWLLPSVSSAFWRRIISQNLMKRLMSSHEKYATSPEKYTRDVALTRNKIMGIVGMLSSFPGK